MDFKTVLGAIIVAVLFFFGIIFAVASVEVPARLYTATLLFGVAIVGLVILYYTTRKPKTIIQRLELSGPMKAAALRCPNCSAPVGANRIKIVAGVPYATCPYCGQTFEVAEEPKW